MDTALFGSISGAKCGLDFIGSDNVLFASDSKSISDRGGKVLIVKNPDQRSGLLLALPSCPVGSRRAAF